jgi:hypothetical protein
MVVLLLDDFLRDEMRERLAAGAAHRLAGVKAIVGHAPRVEADGDRLM